MDDSEQPSPRTGKSQEAPSSGSFLLRIWSEEREIDGLTPKVRVFMRNLKTGEEHYLGDLDQIGGELLRQFQQSGRAPDDPPRKRRSPSGALTIS